MTLTVKLLLIAALVLRHYHSIWIFPYRERELRNVTNVLLGANVVFLLRSICDRRRS